MNNFLKRLSTKFVELDNDDFEKVKTGFNNLFLHKNHMFPSKDGPWVNPKYISSIANEDILSNKNKEIKTGQIYKHYKGDTYKIITLTKHSETAEWLVVYERQTDIAHTGWRIYARPIDMFLGKVIVEGNEINRFEFIK